MVCSVSNSGDGIPMPVNRTNLVTGEFAPLLVSESVFVFDACQTLSYLNLNLCLCVCICVWFISVFALLSVFITVFVFDACQTDIPCHRWIRTSAFFLFTTPCAPFVAPTSNVYLDLCRHIPPPEIKYWFLCRKPDQGQRHKNSIACHIYSTV